MAFRLEHRIGIAASASAIWEVLSDLDGWKSWNPLYPEASGHLRIGEPLTVTLALPGEKPEVIRPVVEDWVPDAQILWRLKLLGGLVATRRYMEIQPLGDHACIFGNGEGFEGVAAGLMPRRLKAAAYRGFAAMGEALKARVETGGTVQA